MRMSSLFGAKHIGFFEIYVCSHGQEELSQRGQAGQFFAILFRP